MRMLRLTRVYRGEPSQSDPERLFFLGDADRQLVAGRRGAHNRLGFALLLTAVRFYNERSRDGNRDDHRVSTHPAR
jgi:Domain of unknown function (DUF4158)